jgi:inhibitor of KinA
VVKFLAAGDMALTVEFGTAATRELSRLVLALDHQIAEMVDSPALVGIIETVPTVRSLTIHYDPQLTSHAAVIAAVTPLLAKPVTAEHNGRAWTLPVCYTPTMAPDLDEVAARTRLSATEVVRLHAATTYRVYMLGFVPGQAYLGDLPTALQLPRRQTPRTILPPGSVAIATTMSTIYPLESPGGWHLIGRCPIRFYDPAAAMPVLLAPADTVRFRPIGLDEWEALATAISEGRWQLQPDASTSGELP